MKLLRRLAKNPVLTSLAIIIGIVVVAADRLLFAYSLHRAVDISEPGIMVMNVLLVAAPFAFLACRGTFLWPPWLVGLIPTIWLNWWWLQKGIAYQKAPDGSGVDMFGALMMLLSPLAITALCVFVDAKLRARPA